MPDLQGLPAELKLEILSHLDLEQVVKCRQVSKQSRAVVDGNENAISGPLVDQYLTRLKATTQIFRLGASEHNFAKDTAVGFAAAVGYFVKQRANRRLGLPDGATSLEAYLFRDEAMLFTRLWQNVNPRVPRPANPQTINWLSTTITHFLFTQLRRHYETVCCEFGPRYFESIWDEIIEEAALSMPSGCWAIWGLRNYGELVEAGRLLTNLAVEPVQLSIIQDDVDPVECDNQMGEKGALLLDSLDSSRLARILGSPTLPPVQGLGYGSRTRAGRDLIEGALRGGNSLTPLQQAKVLCDLYISFKVPPYDGEPHHRN